MKQMTLFNEPKTIKSIIELFSFVLHYVKFNNSVLFCTFSPLTMVWLDFTHYTFFSFMTADIRRIL